MYKFNRFLVDSYGIIWKIPLPLLLIWGRADRLTNPRKALRILKNKAGHVVSLEKPQAVAKAIEDFLRPKIV